MIVGPPTLIVLMGGKRSVVALQAPFYGGTLDVWDVPASWAQDDPVFNLFIIVIVSGYEIS